MLKNLIDCSIQELFSIDNFSSFILSKHFYQTYKIIITILCKRNVK